MSQDLGARMSMRQRILARIKESPVTLSNLAKLVGTTNRAASNIIQGLRRGRPIEFYDDTYYWAADYEGRVIPPLITKSEILACADGWTDSQIDLLLFCSGYGGFNDTKTQIETSH